MTEIQLAGSGGWVNADLTEEQITKSKLIPNMDKHFLASLEKLDTTKMIKHFCKQCNSEFDGPTQIQIDANTRPRTSPEASDVQGRSAFAHSHGFWLPTKMEKSIRNQ